MTIYVVRHAQTDGNLYGYVSGNVDIPLNDYGKKQAINAQKQLKNINFDKVYSSPLQRCLETTTLITNIPPITKDFLKEEGIDYQKNTKALYSFLNDLKKSKYQNILIVTHYNISRTIIAYLTKQNPINILGLRNCEIKIINLNK